MKEVKDKASTNTGHPMNQFADSETTVSVYAGIHKTTTLKTRHYERGKSKENPMTDCKYFA